MAVNYERAAVSLHKETVRDIDTRTVDHVFNTSFVIDRDLTRYYSMVESLRKDIKRKFSDVDLRTLANELADHHRESRKGSLSLLRLLFVGMVNDGKISKSVGAKIAQLGPAEFLTLVDTLEYIYAKKLNRDFEKEAAAKAKED